MLKYFYGSILKIHYDRLQSIFSQKYFVYLQEMQDAFIKHQRIVVMKLKRVSQLTLGLLPANCFTQRKQHLQKSTTT